jgi:hypothetical protein
MRVRIARTRILKIINGNLPVADKYNRIRKLMLPVGERIRKNKKRLIATAVPYLREIYNDQEARILAQDLNLSQTADFLTFLEKITK